MKLTNLQKLAEATSGDAKARKYFDELEDEMEAAYNALEKVRTKLQSSVLTDMLKQEGFPATESKEAKDTMEAAFKAVKIAYGALEDLHMAVGVHFDMKNGEGDDR